MDEAPGLRLSTHRGPIFSRLQCSPGGSERARRPHTPPCAHLLPAQGLWEAVRRGRWGDLPSRRRAGWPRGHRPLAGGGSAPVRCRPAAAATCRASRPHLSSPRGRGSGQELFSPAWPGHHPPRAEAAWPGDTDVTSRPLGLSSGRAGAGLRPVGHPAPTPTSCTPGGCTLGHTRPGDCGPQRQLRSKRTAGSVWLQERLPRTSSRLLCEAAPPGAAFKGGSASKPPPHLSERRQPRRAQRGGAAAAQEGQPRLPHTGL